MDETATRKRAAADPTSDPKDETEAQHIKLLLLGKTGTGKSSFAGIILGENVFGIHHTSVSGTSKCQSVTRQVDDGNITVIDTPGIFDNLNCDDALKYEVIDAIIESSEGIDAFLILFKVERFTEQENEVVSKIKGYFSEEAFKHAVVVFTHGDQLHDNMKIEEFVSDNKYLCDVLEKCENRCCVVDNKYWKNNQQDEYRNNQVQVAKLLETVKEMVKSEGRYTNEMLQEVKRMIEEEEEHIVLKRLAGVTTGVLLGALLGVPNMVAQVLLKLRQYNLPVAASSGVALHEVASSALASGSTTSSGVALCVAAGACAATGAVVGGCIGYEEADKADSVQEAMKNTAEALITPIAQVFERPNITHET